MGGDPQALRLQLVFRYITIIILVEKSESTIGLFRRGEKRDDVRDVK